MFQAAFLYVAPNVDMTKCHAVIPSTDITLTVWGCKNYDEAEIIAKAMVKNGIGAIELCAGFGNEGMARIKKAVGPNIPVGAIRFDFHPGFGFKSGDDMF